MAYPKLLKLRETNEKAANEMVAGIACGVHAGNEHMPAQSAALIALETAEIILVLLAPSQPADTVEMDDDA